MRSVGAVAAGLAAWIVAVTIGNVALRAALPGYGEAEAALRVAPPGDATAALATFTLAMLIARLLLAAAASVAAGLTTARIARNNARMSWILGILLVLLFIPVHVWMWTRFPLWYHAAFLVSLLPCTLLGAALATRTPG